MAKKCCKSKPRCKNCPKRKERKVSLAVDGENRLFFYCATPATVSISGQRG